VRASAKIETLQIEVSHCPIQLNGAAIRHTTSACKTSANILGHNYHSADLQDKMLKTDFNKPALEEGDLAEFEARPFFLVNTEKDIEYSLI
jgi:hypothetical protein